MRNTYKDQPAFTYTYKDTQFHLQKNYSSYNGKTSYSITALLFYGTRIEFPGTFQSGVVTQICLGKDNSYNWYGYSSEVKERSVFPGVLELFIPKETEKICLNNDTFPDLQHLEMDPDNTCFSTNGKLLLSKNRNRLILALAEGMNQKKAVIPSYVKKIEAFAFSDTVCEDISFENPSVSSDEDAFTRSAWLEAQSGAVYVGKTLFKLKDPVHSLQVKPGTIRIQENAFSGNCPEELITPVLPPARTMSKKLYHKCCRLTITNKHSAYNWNTLRSWDSLENVRFENHKLYRDIDGVVFSKDGKTLLFYPQYRKSPSYSVPKSVTTIGRLAFAESRYLEELLIPDSVRTIRQGAFYQCEKLRSVRLPQNLTELADATVFQNYGIFEHCRSLTEVELPLNLRYIGRDAFRECPLTDIRLPEKVSHIGDYAFCNTGLRRITLPKSVQSVGRGALMGIEEVTAYEGTARGLISALEAVSCDSNAFPNIDWKKAVIRMLDRKGSLKDLIMIPESLSHTFGASLESAWNSEPFDYTEYDACFQHIQDSAEKAEFAVKALNRSVKVDLTETSLEDTPYGTYLRRMSSKIVSLLIESGDENTVISFIKLGCLSANSLSMALKLCNEKGMNEAAAYILQLTQKDGRTRKTAKVRI